MTKYQTHPVDDEGWTGWIYPRMDGYRLGCCDCGLVHELRFVIDGDQVAFNARRHERATAAKRRERKRRAVAAQGGREGFGAPAIAGAPETPSTTLQRSFNEGVMR